MRNRFFFTLLITIVLTLAVTSAVAAEEDVGFSLDNGMRVIISRGASIPYFSAVLVCPLPPLSGESDRAAAAMLNRLIWSGGEGFGTSVSDYEYGMIALRFNGSIGSQLTPDALLIHYTMPSRHLDSVFRYMAMQWTSVQFDARRLESARRTVAAEEESKTTSSVLRQLMREIEPRLWPDLDYRYHGSSSMQELGTVGEDEVRAMYERMQNPVGWTLFISGDVQTSTVRAILDETLGTIGAAETESSGQAEPPPGEEPQLGIRLQLPADLSQRHALAAYRLPPAGEINTAAVLLLARYMNNAPGVAALRSELGDNALVSVGFDIRGRSGIFYFYAAWDDDPAKGDVVARLAGIAENTAGLDFDREILETTRKILLIDYWTRRQATQPYALWRASRIAVGLQEDDLVAGLQGIDEDNLKAAASQMLTADNRLNLVTIEK